MTESIFDERPLVTLASLDTELDGIDRSDALSLVVLVRPLDIEGDNGDEDKLSTG